MVTASELLGPEGGLSRVFKAYEARPGQLAMASAVERALHEERVLLCEAGTGTGKTLAYLVPAILSRKKVVISTATRALQEQLLTQDLPLIERAFGLSPKVTLMKGLGNYLCRRRYAEFKAQHESLDPQQRATLAHVESWVRETETGDLSELVAFGEDDPIRRHVASGSDTRLGPVCPYFSECFVTHMRRQAESADLVIVNHHLFFADLALRGPHPARVIPDYEAVIFDEAHQLEDVATEFFGAKISRTKLERLARDAERVWSALGLSDRLLTGPDTAFSVKELTAAAEQLWSWLRTSFADTEGRSVMPREQWVGDAAKAGYRLDEALEALAIAAEMRRGRLGEHGAEASEPRFGGMGREALDSIARRAGVLREQLAQIMQGAKGHVVWFELNGGEALAMAPIDLSEVFRTRLFEQLPTVILTSATLSTGARRSVESKSPFAYVRSRLGISESTIGAEELVVESPFDFENRALLYTPRDLPFPDQPAFCPDAAARILELIEVTDGGCFVLTTSLRVMQKLHRSIQRELGSGRVWVQGSRPKSALLSAFRAQGNAVLVATQSFWEGVDVPGRALRLVILEKVPFPVPSDPLVQARAAALQAEGQSAFWELYVPAAAIALKQGFGRLIRNASDTGIVALLDGRIHHNPYGRRLLDALPNARRTDELAAVRRFWAERDREGFGLER